MKKKRATFDLNVSPLQQVWLEVLGVDAPWLATTKVAPLELDVVQGVASNRAPNAKPSATSTSAPATAAPVKAPTRESAPAVVKLESASKLSSTQLASNDLALRIAKTHTNLDDLNEQIRACKACNLCQNRTQAVVGKGAQRPAIMIVGEAPSEQEDRLNVPFSGRSGELLDKMLAAIGRQRDRDVYLTHVVKCRTPNSRNPQPEEMAACLPFLLAEIATIKPQLILAMGRSAALALLGQDAPLEMLREQLWSFDLATNRVLAVAPSPTSSFVSSSTSTVTSIPLIVTYHPAFLLSSPADKKRAWQDLQKARDLIEEA
jgi:uracil-DNA glycosylase family 4